VTPVAQPVPSIGRLERVVVVGASLAGLRACEVLRASGFAGTITLVGAERHRPYDRPPLSKKLLAGDWEPERIQLRQPDAFDALGLDARLGVSAVGLDLDGRAVTLADGTTLAFDGAVLATGSQPRRLPDQPRGVLELRTLDDALVLRDRIADGTARVIIVGAGFIGLEVAATALGRGCTVTVLEGAPAPLMRGLGAELGAAATRALVERGVDVRCAVTVAAVASDAVTLGTGERVAGDVVLIGIGVAPTTGWLDGSGLTITDGVVADATLRAAPGVYVAGDLARWPHTGFDEEIRIEHWTNAAEQGAAAARNLLAAAAGAPGEEFATVPFVWSDQGRHRIQVLGRPATEPDDETHVAVGDLEGHAFVALIRRGEHLRGAVGVNAPKQLMAYQKLLAAGASWTEARALAATQTAPPAPAPAPTA